MHTKVKRIISILLSFVLILSVSVCPVYISAGEIVETKSYNAVEAIKAASETGVLNSSSVWSYSERVISKNSETGVYETSSEWVSKDLVKVEKPTVANNATLKTKMANALCVNESRTSDTKNGFFVDNNKIVAFVGAQNGYAPSLTFTAPKSGTVCLYSPNNGKIGGAGSAAPYWTLNGNTKKMGIAVYLENEKLWPLDDNYYVLTQSKSTITFPEIYADVRAGQKIRIEFISLENMGWGFSIASPQVDYHWIEPDSQQTNYTAVSTIGNAIENGSLPIGSVWSYSERKITLNSATSLYEPTSDIWLERDLQKVDTPCGAADSVIKNKMANALCVNENRGTDTKNGFFIDNNEIVTYINCNNGYAPSITFNAPKSGELVLGNVGNITAPGTANPYWTLNNSSKKIGLAVFHNGEKLWPESSDYYVFTQTNRTLTLPEIYVTVEKGDKICFEVVGLNHGWGFFKLSPKADYLTSDTLITEFPAVNTIKKAEKNGLLLTDDVWSYSESPLAYENGTGEFGYDGKWTGKYYPTLEWKDITLDQNAWRADLPQLKKIMPDRLYHKAANTVFLGNGFASYKNQVVTYIGAYNMVASALTFNAPYSGMVNLYDPNSRKAGALSPNSIFETLTSGVSQNEIGFAIYHNNEKIWPENEDFYTLTSKEKTVAFPSIMKLKVNKGDKLRICFFARKGNEQMGFCGVSPQVDYTDMNAFNLSYNAAEVLKTNAAKDGEWTAFNNDCWSYQEISSALQTVNYNGTEQSVVLPSGIDWTTPAVRITKTSSYCSMSGGVRDKIQKYMYWYWDGTAGDGRGMSYYNNGMVMTVGTGKSNSLISSALVFKAPLNGQISLYDPNGGIIGESGVYSYDEYGGKIGIAIYKNEEKLWPKDGEADTIGGYYVLNDGIYDSETGTYTKEGNNSVAFPKLSEVSVKSGDLIRIVAVPLDMKWKFIRLNPQIEYTKVNEANWSDEAIALKITEYPEMTRYFVGEKYDFSGLKAAIRRANGAFDELTLNGTEPKLSYTMTVPEETVGKHKVWLTYDDGSLKYSEAFDVEVLYKKYGDLNADGIINALDLAGLGRLLLGNKKGVHEIVADTSGDDNVNIIDLIRLKKFVAGAAIALGPQNQMSEEAADALKNISVTAIGDSYFGGHKLGKDSTWLKIFADKYNILLNNYGINGSTVSDYRTDLWPMCVRYSSMENGADIVIFEGGHNDCSYGFPLGTVNSTDSKTFAGAVNVLISGLKEKYPDAMLIGLTSWYVSEDMKQYSDMMLEVCKAQGVPCINAADKELTGVDMESDVFRKEYCQSEGDHAHLNEKGAALVEPIFERIIGEEYLKFKSAK